MTELNIDDCINETCPWSGKPVQADSLALYGDDVVGFCNPGEQPITSAPYAAFCRPAIHVINRSYGQ